MSGSKRTPGIRTIVEELLAFTPETTVTLSKVANCAQSTIVGIRKGADPRYSTGKALEELWRRPTFQLQIRKGRNAAARLARTTRFADCGECGSEVQVTGSGVLKRHRRPGAGTTLDNANVCPGSGEAPEEGARDGA